MKADVIIQARCSSSRLPDKVLRKLQGKTVLEHICLRMAKCDQVGRILVATSTDPSDDRIIELLRDLPLHCFRGSLEDVLGRYYETAKRFNVENIVRITADNPVIDPKIVDQVIARFFKEKADYCANNLVPTFPDGEDVEVFTREALAAAWGGAKLPSEREHVTPFIRNQKKRFKVVSFENKKDLSGMRWTLDQEEDFRFLEALYEGLYSQNPFFGMDEILAFLKKNPEIEKINGHIIPNEGYLKSLKEDELFLK